MTIDWNLIFKDAVDAATSAAKNNEPRIRAYLSGVQAGHELALANMALAYAQGDIDKPTLESSLEDELETVRNELLAVEVMTKATLQKAVNAFLDALSKGIKAAVFAII